MPRPTPGRLVDASALIALAVGGTLMAAGPGGCSTDEAAMAGLGLTVLIGRGVWIALKSINDALERILSRPRPPKPDPPTSSRSRTP